MKWGAVSERAKIFKGGTLDQRTNRMHRTHRTHRTSTFPRIMGDAKSYIDEKFEQINEKFEQMNARLDAADTSFRSELATFEAKTLSMITNMKKNMRSSSSSLLDNNRNAAGVSSRPSSTANNINTVAKVDSTSDSQIATMMDPTLRWTAAANNNNDPDGSGGQTTSSSMPR